MKFPFQNVALIGKHKAPEIAEPLLRLADFLVSRGVTVVVDSLTAEHIKDSYFPAMTLDEIGHVADLAIVLGGDGTMLNIARTLSPCQIPLVGVNQGRLGFLTDLSLENMQESIAAMLDGKFVTEQRLLLVRADIARRYRGVQRPGLQRSRGAPQQRQQHDRIRGAYRRRVPLQSACRRADCLDANRFDRVCDVCGRTDTAPQP